VEPTRIVPFFNYPDVFGRHEDEYVRIFTDIGRRGAFIQQQELADFEAELARYTGARHALGVANGTDALVIVLRAAGIGAGDEVIVCSHTMAATAAAVAHVGARPVPVEVGPDRLIDPESVAAALTTRTRAVMPTDLNGRTADMDRLLELTSGHGLLLVEDAAQALGSRFRGTHAGLFGVGGTISFYPAKTLGCFGDGGAIITDDDAVYEQAVLMRDHGRTVSGDVALWGYNSRLDNLQAAILLAKFGRYDADVARRREVAARYQDGLGDVAQLGLPPAPSDGEHFDIFQNYEIEADRRDDLRAALADRGVGTIIQWGGIPVHRYSVASFEGTLPATDRFFERCLMLPMNTSINDDDVEHVIASVREFYGDDTP